MQNPSVRRSPSTARTPPATVLPAGTNHGFDNVGCHRGPRRHAIPVQGHERRYCCPAADSDIAPRPRAAAPRSSFLESTARPPKPHNGSDESAFQRSRDLTVVAVPFYFGSMAAEYLWLRRRAARRGPTAGDYERRDTLASPTQRVSAAWWRLWSYPSCSARSLRAGGDMAGRWSSWPSGRLR